MAYSTDHLRTAGKVTVYTALLGVLVFAVVFILNLGTAEFKVADAQSQYATTTVYVLNTAPNWTASTTEEFESSSDNPTNAGDEVAWIAVATDSNSTDYYLLICEDSATPTPGEWGVAPTCTTGTQWAVSPSTSSGNQARAATTTTASTSPFGGESFVWYAWVCDADVSATTSAACNQTPTQGTNATNSSPFEVNHRPNFTAFWDDSPAVPGAVVTFTSTSSDNDISGVADTVKLFVCATEGFSTTTDTCTGTTLASTTVAVASDATASYTVVIPTQDQDYGAYGYVFDNHGFEAAGAFQGYNATMTVANAAPSVTAASIILDGGTDMSVTVAAGETTGFTLSFITSDNNTCDAVDGVNGDEVVDWELSIYRNGSGSGSTTCAVDNTGHYDPNDCYTSAVATTTWDIACTASTTTCTGTETMQWDCTFPLWYVADPTTGTSTQTYYFDNDWRAQVRAVDDNGATGTLSQSTVADIDVDSLMAFALNDTAIPYGALAPGERTDPLVATTTISATGNVGLDKDVQGEAMCEDYTTATKCQNSSTSTIPAQMQVFGTTTVSYGFATTSGDVLSSTTPREIEINVLKSTATSSQEVSSAYWGIEVPDTITYSGSYTGENTITAVLGEPTEWY